MPAIPAPEGRAEGSGVKVILYYIVIQGSPGYMRKGRKEEKEKKLNYVL